MFSHSYTENFKSNYVYSYGEKTTAQPPPSTDGWVDENGAEWVDENGSAWADT